MRGIFKVDFGLVTTISLTEMYDFPIMQTKSFPSERTIRARGNKAQREEITDAAKPEKRITANLNNPLIGLPRLLQEIPKQVTKHTHMILTMRKRTRNMPRKQTISILENRPMPRQSIETSKIYT